MNALVCRFAAYSENGRHLIDRQGGPRFLHKSPRKVTGCLKALRAYYRGTQGIVDTIRNSILVPRLAAELSSYVAARWLRALVEHVLRPTVLLRKRVLLGPTSAPKHSSVGLSVPDFSYREVINVSALAELIALNDPLGGAWVKTINRWLAEEQPPHAPEPETIRRALTALGYDWVVGLGLSGYKQHAIAMLHALCRDGAYLPALQARAIFKRGRYIQDAITWHSVTSIGPRRRRHSLPEESRLDDAAKRCWIHSDGRGIPTKATMPRDLFSSQKLYTAWCVLETALNGKASTLEGRMAEADQTVSSYVLSWVDDITTSLDSNPPSKPPSVTKRRP
jgi:hypothetical protein